MERNTGQGVVGSRRPVKNTKTRLKMVFSLCLLYAGNTKRQKVPTNLVGMRTSDKDDRSLFRDLVGTTGLNLSKEDVKKDGEKEGDKVIDLETHGWLLFLLLVGWNECWLSVGGRPCAVVAGIQGKEKAKEKQGRVLVVKEW